MSVFHSISQYFTVFRNILTLVGWKLNWAGSSISQLARQGAAGGARRARRARAAGCAREPAPVRVSESSILSRLAAPSMAAGPASGRLAPAPGAGRRASASRAAGARAVSGSQTKLVNHIPTGRAGPCPGHSGWHLDRGVLS